MSSDAIRSVLPESGFVEDVNAILLASTAYYPRPLVGMSCPDEKPTTINSCARALDALAALCDTYGDDASATCVTYLGSKHELLFSTRKTTVEGFSDFVQGLIKVAHRSGDLFECLEYVYDKCYLQEYAKNLSYYGTAVLNSLEGPVELIGEKAQVQNGRRTLKNAIRQLIPAVSFISELPQDGVPDREAIVDIHERMAIMIKLIEDARVSAALSYFDVMLVDDLMGLTVVHRSMMNILTTEGGEHIDFLQGDQPQVTWIHVPSTPRQFFGSITQDTIGRWLKESPLDNLPTAQEILKKVIKAVDGSENIRILNDRIESIHNTKTGVHCFSELLLRVSQSAAEPNIHIGCTFPICHPCNSLLRAINRSSPAPRFTVSQTKDFYLLPWILPEPASGDVKKALTKELREDLMESVSREHGHAEFGEQ